MPNETKKIYADEAGFYFSDKDDIPDATSTDVYWSDKPDHISGDVESPTFEWLNDGNKIQQNLVSFRPVLEQQTEIIRATLVYKTAELSSFGNLLSGEQLNITVKAFDADDWDVSSDGPDDNTEAVTMWTLNTTIQEATGSIIRRGGGVYILIADVGIVLQEIIDRVGWVAGNKILFFIHIDSLTGNVTSRFTDCETVRDTPMAYAYLEVEYYYNPHPGGGDIIYWDDLEFIEEYSAFNWTISYEDTLEFEEDIVAIKEHNRSFTQTLTFIENISFFVNELFVDFEDFLFVHQTISASRSREISLEQTVSFVEVINRNTNFNKQIEDELVFDEDIDSTSGYTRSLEQIFSFTQDLDADKKNKSLIQQLTITQMITFEVTQPVTISYSDTITFEQDIDTNHNATIEYEDILNITQTILAYTENSVATTTCGRYDLIWKPFSAGVGFPSEPSLIKGDITLNYVGEFGPLFFTLPAPNFTDREELLLTRIQRKTRGGDLKTFSDSEWPKVRTFRYKFDNLTLDKISDFHDVLNTTLGKSIILIDHEGRSWIGYIVNPQGEAANFARSCGSTTEFDFDGRIY